MGGKIVNRVTFQFGFFVVLTLFLQGCAVMGAKSNGDKLAALSGEAFVLSNAAKEVDFNELFASQGKANTVLSIVPTQDQAAVTKLHQGSSSISQALTITDSSNAIVTSLAKYYQANYQIKFIAKGTIRNISPDFLQRALKKGRYVLDVRLTELTLEPDETGLRFYPKGSYQLSVIDAQKAKVVIEDQCRFEDISNTQRLALFSANGGKALSEFLSQYANDCLRYFALGEPMPLMTGTGTNKEVSKPAVAQRVTDQTTAAISVGASFQFTKDVYDVSQTLQGYDAFYLLDKPLANGHGFVFQSSISALGQNDWPDFSSPTYVVALGAGTSLKSDKYNDLRYAVLATTKLGQYRQQLLALSTNSIGLEAQVIKVFFDRVVLTGRYGLDKHIGQTKDANSISHLFGLSVGYQFSK